MQTLQTGKQEAVECSVWGGLWDAVRRDNHHLNNSSPPAALLENKMLAKGKEQRVFGNSSLRDKWEKRAQNVADQCKQEAEWKEKSDQKL